MRITKRLRLFLTLNPNFRYREALAIELPWLGIGEKPAEKAVANNKTETVAATVA